MLHICFGEKKMIKLNTDKEFVKQFKEKLRANNNYCPCRLVKNEDTKCMCKEFREQQDGWCHCGLYYKEEEQ